MEVPPSSVYMLTRLDLLGRGLCTTLDVKLPYVQLMGGYARAALTAAACPSASRALRPLPPHRGTVRPTGAQPSAVVQATGPPRND